MRPAASISSEPGLSLPSSWSSGGFSWNSVMAWFASVFKMPKAGASSATTGIVAIVTSALCSWWWASMAR